MAAQVSTRRLALLVLLPACYTWRPVTLPPNTGYERDGRVRVQSRAHSTDSLIPSADSAGKSKKQVLDRAWVEGDSLHGIRYASAFRVRYGRMTGSKQDVAIPVADVQRAEEQRISGWRTTFAVVALTGVVLVLLASLSASATY